MGAAIAQRLLDAGAKVVVTGRSRGEATPAGATFIAGDVSSVEGVKAVAAKAKVDDQTAKYCDSVAGGMGCRPLMHDGAGRRGIGRHLSMRGTRDLPRERLVY